MSAPNAIAKSPDTSRTYIEIGLSRKRHAPSDTSSVHVEVLSEEIPDVTYESDEEEVIVFPGRNLVSVS
jgi:hypothetical protein